MDRAYAALSADVQAQLARIGGDVQAAFDADPVCSWRSAVEGAAQELLASRLAAVLSEGGNP